MSNALKMATAFGGATGNKSLYQIISDLGLTTNLKLCLDAGDSASYDSSVQTVRWLDTSGGGYDFFIGATSSSEASDPTFNGTAGGLSSSEYWSFDGGDYFKYDTTTESWMQTLHKDGANVTFFVVAYFPSLGTAEGVFGTRASTTGTGVSLFKSATSRVQFIVNSGSNTVVTINGAADALATGWNIAGLSLAENAGSNNVDILAKSLTTDTTQVLTASYTNPSTSNIGDTVTIGAATNGSSYRFLNGSRIACLAVWDSKLTISNLEALRDNIKGRFGL